MFIVLMSGRFLVSAKVGKTRAANCVASGCQPAAETNSPQSALRKPLETAPASVSAAAPQSAISVACAGARPKATATAAVPSDWPIRPSGGLQAGRPAASLAWRAADDHPIVRRRKNPKPRPQIARRQASETGGESPMPVATRTNPPPITNRPMLPRMPGMNGSASAGDRSDQSGRDRPGGGRVVRRLTPEWPSLSSR